MTEENKKTDSEVDQGQKQDKKVVIYSTPTCHFCVMAKDYFKSPKI